MWKMRICVTLLSLPFMPAISRAENYVAERTVIDGIDVVRLIDRASEIEVLVAPSVGNNAYEMKVKGKKVFWSPYQTLAELKATPRMAGNPFLAPWANRIDGESYFANGRKYSLNPELENYRKDGSGFPIHGLLVYASDWKVESVVADQESASVSSRLEFWRSPARMAQFPFAHTITMTYRLAGGSLEVQTEIENLAAESMPVSVGYHTYYQINDAPRNEWKVFLGAKDRLLLSEQLIPTGERVPVSDRGPFALADTKLDDLFASLVRDSEGRAEFSVRGVKEKIAVLFGPQYTIGVVYAPPGREFICFEPMSGPTNAFNLSHAGIYDDLQKIPPGRTWRESFWIRPSGF
jgi:aldose 1-epimerase